MEEKIIVGEQDIKVGLIDSFPNAMDFDTSKRFTNALCEYVAGYEGDFRRLDIDFMKTAVSRLIIEADGKMRIRFVNGKEISESEVLQNE